ncbi:MAG: hypothetical protein WCE44_04025 [Candidatus Velthaea sp.]
MYATCIDRLDWEERSGGTPTEAATLLRARALLRLDRAADALRLLREEADDTNGRERGVEARMLMAAALARSEGLEEGVRLLLSIRESALGRESASVLSEIEYEVGITYWTLRRYDEAMSWALEGARRAAGIHSAKAIALCGWTLLARGQTRAALERFEEAFGVYADGAERDEHFSAQYRARGCCTVCEPDTAHVDERGEGCASGALTPSRGSARAAITDYRG